LNQIPINVLVDVFDNWMRRLQRYIDINGEYVEERLFCSIYGFPQTTHSGDATVRVEHPVHAELKSLHRPEEIGLPTGNKWW
jgi:hypothetical protein